LKEERQVATVNSERIPLDDLPNTTLEIYWRAAFAGTVQRRTQYRIKRVIDVIGASALLLLLSPLWLVIALAIKLTSPGPVLYRQVRLGQDWQEFTLLKFRTMIDGADRMLAHVAAQNEASGPLFKARKDPRITAVGRVLRRTFLDELPQFINVIRGEMSLIGPRPCLANEAAQVEEELYFRFAVPQGITGPWQTGGYHALSFQEQFAIECRYVQSWTLAKDFAIFLRTIPTVLRLSGR
jgi:lipopolysaccharide/colanic/teichoic acid biosynthesis glycosyltransferase